MGAGEGGGYGKWIQENTIFMRFCCCFKLSKKVKKHAITKCTDWLSAIDYEILLEVRFEVVRVYFTQRCFFLPLPHVPVGIQHAIAASEKTKDPGLHKGNTG